MTLNRFLSPVLILLLALTPVAWQRLVDTPFGQLGYFHLAAMLLWLCVAGSPEARRALGRVLLETPYVWLASAVLYVITVLTFLKLHPPFLLADLVRQGFYAITALAAGCAVVALHGQGKLRHLAWAAPAAVVAFLFFMYTGLSAAGGDAIAIFSKALSSGKPEQIIYPLFRSAFQSGNVSAEEVRSNLRHDVMFALVLAVLVSGIGIVHQGRRLRRVAAVSVGFILVIAVFSFSRSTWLAMFLIGCLYFSGLTMKSNRAVVTWAVIVQFGLAAIIYLWAFTPVVELLINRVTDAGSYVARSHAAEARFEAITDHLWIGAPNLQGDWAHNLLIDYWSASGILGGLAAMVLLIAMSLLILRYWIAAVSASHGKVMLVLCSCLYVLPFVRLMTAPKGHLSMSPWLAIGFAAAVAAVLRHQRARAASARPPLRGAYQPYGQVPVAPAASVLARRRRAGFR